jgi:hypothetical protein
METFSSYRNSSLRFAKRARRRRFITAGLLIILIAASAYLLFFPKFWRSEPNEVKLSTKNPVAELVSATGVVLMEKPGRKAWHPVSLGARLTDGDLIKTDQFANALVRYANGTTVSIKEKTIFTVGSVGNNGNDASVPPQDTDQSSSPSKPEDQLLSGSEAGSGNGIKTSNQEKNAHIHPFMKLERIVAFGRSLELVGTVETGSRLVINDEVVDISGDGSFKHFTKPFPVSAQKVRLVMKITDLADRTRAETVAYDFDPHGRKN